MREHEISPRSAVLVAMAAAGLPTFEEGYRDLGEASADLKAQVDRIRREGKAEKDGAYEERNRCVALVARMALLLGWEACRCRTVIEGWSEDWHGCVRIELPTGQVSWHYHDSQAHLFEWLPEGEMEWDGHDTPEKYRRVGECAAGRRALR